VLVGCWSGGNIRNILHKLGDVFEVFEDALVYQFTQAANDLNLSFVVDEEQAPRCWCSCTPAVRASPPRRAAG
jgi:hypothetical protein